MLVLARKPNESIIIGENVRIVVVQIQAGRVRLGIEAPPSIRIRRSEIHPLVDETAVEFDIVQILAGRDHCAADDIHCQPAGLGTR